MFDPLLDLLGLLKGALNLEQMVKDGLGLNAYSAVVVDFFEKLNVLVGLEVHLHELLFELRLRHFFLQLVKQRLHEFLLVLL